MGKTGGFATIIMSAASVVMVSGPSIVFAAACLQPGYDANKHSPHLEWITPIDNCIDLTNDIVVVKTGKLLEEPKPGDKPKPDEEPKIPPRIYFFFQTGLPVGEPYNKQFTVSYGLNTPIELWHQDKPVRLKLSSELKDWFPFGATVNAYPTPIKEYPGLFGGYGCAKDLKNSSRP